MDLKSFIRDVPDFPKPGIVFKDITPLLASPDAFSYVVTAFEKSLSGQSVDVVASIESRGFFFAAPLSMALGAALVPIRKQGKLPYKTRDIDYDLEYGTDTLSIHEDAVKPGQRVVIVDDLLATGGTMGAAIKLVEACGGEVVALPIVIELKFLKGRDQIQGYPLHTMLSYD